MSVVGEAVGSGDFGELSPCESAHDIHLPEAVLRGDIALREEQIGHAGGIKGGDALFVPRDRHLLAQARGDECAVELW